MGKSLSHDFEKMAPYYDFALKFLLFFFGGEQRLRRKIASFLSCRNLKRGAKILEVGSGTGANLKALEKVFPEKYEFVGVDSSPSMIAEAKNKRLSPKTAFLLADAGSLPLENESFDAALAVFTLHELPEAKRVRALKEIGRVLKKNGCFLIVDFSYPKNIFGQLLFPLLKIIEKREALEFAINGLEKVEQNFPFKKQKEKRLLLGLAKMVLYENQEKSSI